MAKVDSKYTTIDMVSSVVPCQSCKGTGAFKKADGTDGQCFACKGSGQMSVIDLLAWANGLNNQLIQFRVAANRKGARR